VWLILRRVSVVIVSDVYYATMRCKGPDETVVHKLRKTWAISKVDLVAVKVHLEESIFDHSMCE
jgi:uncharacterized Fe-S center protein